MSFSPVRISRREALAVASCAALSLVDRTTAGRATTTAKLIPRPSDVIFSSRWMLPESIPIAVAAGATRFDWTYSERHDYYAAIKAAGIAEAGGTINLCPPDQTGSSTYRIGRQMNRTGWPIEAPWLKGLGWYYGCVNNPDFLNLQLGRVKRLFAAGTLALQHDDAACSIASVNWGGCWCPYCRSAARAQGYDLVTQMRSFQTASTVRYIKALRERINAAIGREVTLSCNNFRMRMSTPYPLFDYGMCEIDPVDAEPTVLEAAYRQFERDGWMQVVTLRSSDIALNRATIARVHALGGAMLFPFNVYMQSGPRFTANADDVSSFYRFVRAIGPLLDASRFTGQDVADFLSAESLAALRQSNVGTILRRAGAQTVLHLVPGSYLRAAPLLDIRFSAAPGEIALRSAEAPAARIVHGANLNIAPWDWSTVTFGS